MTDRSNSPRPMGFVSPISDTNVKDPNEKSTYFRSPRSLTNHHSTVIDHKPLQKAAHYLKNAVTLEPKENEKRRESIISEHKHVNDHGGPQAEAEFWEKHQKGGQHGAVHETGHTHEHGHGHGHIDAANEPVGHVTARGDRSGGPVTGTMF
ncbi:hypothetical protein IQ06DRAFT_36159 [Phaeosphaeriaceae sp. SRC1lsM3a]|nr:hypothetical protein IQ06DRAFT_36159 [Stagonospora sp. SRC1lsM3a]